MRQFGGQDRRLHAVEAAVDALDVVLMLDQAAMAREHGHVLGERTVVGYDRAGVAHRTQILARIRRISCRSAKSADLLALEARQMRACVLSSMSHFWRRSLP
jgi:hypothetical protein